MNEDLHWRYRQLEVASEMPSMKISE
jgi:LAS superfamily LD-carboxypeptidase LdcB